MTTATAPKRTKRPPATCEVRADENGVTIILPKASSVALTRARDVCAALAASAPIISAKANGIRKALDGLIADINSGPQPVSIPEDEPEQE